MIRFDALALAAMMASACAGTAFASDLPPEIKMPEVSVKDAQGWYVRGDFGYAINAGHGDTSFRTFDPADGDYSSGRFDSDRFSDDFSGGLGVGYQFNDLFRADLTGDYFSGDYEGRTSSASPCSGSAGGTGCSTKARSSFKAGSLMVNGYVDLGTLAGFTPYVGAGLGATRISWSSVNAVGSCVDGSSSCGGSSSVSTRYPGDSDWRFTYALMAGVAYEVAPNVKLDLGYRFSHVAGGDMFGYSAADSAAGAGGTMGRDGALSRHEIRVGLRITTW
ncbi:porin family protein [Agrobacterium rhizogenes]|uniref:outer membrane protein n=1 Tax=Rhizobium rhizogenes TaxID=359 RepID=UPI00064784DB|nr:outer membrane protein [Rhizobium rhizogenes]OCJ13637.1 heat resistant agglutinin 1 protein [Agrobacterium sp. B131/95]OCJ16674.1 heat resistant agglutinin 1 protein [Agrobacterium sp. B133/95]NTG74717.1 porin family protein [Rhizobium rhizogenes]NTI42543.1 porin family protein [Rhizobium rhizogenes]NTI49586.1 porin family protein [Rhizobium rhizogenes]